MNDSINSQIETYEDDSQIFQLVMHLNGTLSLFTTLLGLYMIIFRSTSQMSTYKWYLLNITLWSAGFDIFVGVFYVPQLMFPSFGICSGGLGFKSLGVQILMAQFTMWLAGGLAVSICCAFLYRLAAITQNIHLLHCKKSIFVLVILHLFYISPAMLIDLYAMLHDYNGVMGDLKSRFPAIYTYSLTHGCAFFSTKVTPMASLLFPSLVVGQIFVFVVANMLLIYVILQKLNKDRATMSRKTFSMHKQLTVSLAIQFTLSNLFLALPFLFITILILIDRLDTPLARISGLVLFVMGSLHSTLNSVTMICMTRPYRRTLIEAYYFLMCQRRGRTMSIVGFENSLELSNLKRKQSMFVVATPRLNRMMSLKG